MVLGLACEQALHVNHVELRTKPAWWERPREREGLRKRTACNIIMYSKHRRIFCPISPGYTEWNTVGWKMTHRQPDAPPRAGVAPDFSQYRLNEELSRRIVLEAPFHSNISLRSPLPPELFFWMFVTHIAKQLKIILLSDKAKIAFSPYFWPKTEKKKFFSV